MGNLVFNVLREKHGEIEESRMLFLYLITQRKEWNVLASTKTILIEKDGILKNFPDHQIEQLNLEWLNLKAIVDYNFLTNKIAKMRAEYDRPAPKDGDVWEFGNMNNQFREMKF